MEPKLIIYYEPLPSFNQKVKSVTFSLSRLNNNDNTYRLKLIKEHYLNDECISEDKMKEFHIGLDKLSPKITQIDFLKKYSAPILDGKHDYFLIKYGDLKIETSDKSEIQYILDLFDFDKLATITYQHYPYIKDMYEYVKLVEILNSKNDELNGKQLVKLSKMFRTCDPYRLFRNMYHLSEYLDRF